MKLVFVFLVFISPVLKDNKNFGFFPKVWNLATQATLLVEGRKSQSLFFVEKKLKITKAESQVDRKKKSTLFFREKKVKSSAA